MHEMGNLSSRVEVSARSAEFDLIGHGRGFKVPGLRVLVVIYRGHDHSPLGGVIPRVRVQVKASILDPRMFSDLCGRAASKHAAALTSTAPFKRAI